MKKTFYFIILLTATSLAAHAQQENNNMKRKNESFQRMWSNQKFSDQNQRSGLKINPYWKAVMTPHLLSSFEPQVKVPSANAVWAKVGYDTTGNDAKWFLRTADAGRTWRYDSIPSPSGYEMGNMAVVDGYTCYASMFNETTGFGGGIFRTKDGGVTWKQLSEGQLLSDTSDPDLVYFYDAKNGVAVGDARGPGKPYMEIYTTRDEGATWNRVLRENIPTNGGDTLYSYTNQVYEAFESTLWFRAYDNAASVFIYRSDDLGQHWRLFNTPGAIAVFAFSDKQNGVAAAFDSAGEYIAASHNGGESFERVTFTGSPFVFITAIPHTGTFLTSFPGTSYSNDYRTTWTIIDSGITAIHSNLRFLNPLMGWKGDVFDPDPTGGMFKWKLNPSFCDNSFAATISNNNVLLNWQIENEIFSDHYSVERSTDGINFSGKGEVVSQNDPHHQYIFEDNNTVNKRQYYRLNLVGSDGAISYSKTITINLADPQLKLYPNPVIGRLKVEGLNANATPNFLFLMPLENWFRRLPPAIQIISIISKTMQAEPII